MLSFFHSDESSSIDSNSRRLIDVEVNCSIERHVGRAWNMMTIDEKHAVCCPSDVAESFNNQHPHLSPSCRGFFHQNCCKHLKNPSSQSCVEIITSGQMD